MDTRTYLSLLRRARRQSRRADEAADLLQTALLAAIEAQRGDMTRSENRWWLGGMLRKRALHEARSAARRQQREGAYARLSSAIAGEEAAEDAPEPFVASLPPALRTTALLALTGHTKPEIAWLLRLSDAALRQRLSEIRHRWRKCGLRGRTPLGEPKGELPFGLLRRALIGRVRDTDVVLASHDPDGHLFVVTSQIASPRQQGASDI